MRVELGCMIRDGDTYFDAFAARCEQFAETVDLRMVVCENNSRDQTADRLFRWDPPFPVHKLIQRDDCPTMGSVDHPDRWAHVAHAMNVVMENLSSADVFLYVDPDLVWEPAVALTLCRQVDAHLPAVGPLTLYNGRAYDLWGTTRKGRGISPHPPYFEEPAEGLWPVDTLACMLAVRHSVAKITRWPEFDANKGWCRDITTVTGLPIYLDTRLKIAHP